MIDLSQIVCKALVEEESNTNSRERIFATILYNDNLNIEEIMEQTNYLGVNLSGKYRVVVLQMYEHNGDVNGKSMLNEGYLMEVRESTKKSIETEFRSYGIRHLMVLSQHNSAAILLPAELFSRDLLITILTNIMKREEGKYHVFMKAGVGTAYEYIKDFKKSFQEARNALSISNMVTKKQKVYFYEDLGIYSLIAQISNGQFLDDYVENKIGKLIKADQMQDGDLCETLETYLEHNCNANATAEALFIHRNTMRYRMDKIKRILNDDINDMSMFLELKLAFAIKKYRENREEK